jgi:hypothetical protein
MKTNHGTYESTVLKSTPVTASNLVYEVTEILANYKNKNK